MRAGELREQLAYVPADSVVAVNLTFILGICKLVSVDISKVSENHQVVYLTAIHEAPEL